MENNTSRNTLIIVPGWLQTSHQWGSAASELPQWDVHVIDLPGFGVAPLVSSEWGVPEYAQFVKEKIQQIAFSPGASRNVVLLGHSFGGRVLAYMCGTDTDFTHGIKKLILYAAPCIYRPSMTIRARSFAAHMAKKMNLARYLPESLKPVELRQAEHRQLLDVFKRTVSFDLTRELVHITTSTTLLWGELDTSVPISIAQEMRRTLPNSTLIVLPGEGHCMHSDNPQLFFGTLRSMLA
jgi:pimeloyl-ACP methyl ester carboxylesterase